MLVGQSLPSWLIPPTDHMGYLHWHLDSGPYAAAALVVCDVLASAPQSAAPAEV